MITNLTIKNFKCLISEVFELKNLNIITGVNSTGKSSVIQAILSFAKALIMKPSLDSFPFEKIRNRFENAKEISIELNNLLLKIDEKKFDFDGECFSFLKDIDFFYLSESRFGPLPIEQLANTESMGDHAEFVMNFLYKHQSDSIQKELVKCDFETLAANVDYWLKVIFNNQSLELSVEPSSSQEQINVFYKQDGLDQIIPTQLGAGISYVAKILIVCLQAKIGQTVIIENPEIHLHPAAQSAMGHFLTFIASKGIQIIVETHCENLINKIQYDVLKNNIESADVNIYYKTACKTPFELLSIGNDGHFQKNGQRASFPEGFFDASLSALLEIG